MLKKFKKLRCCGPVLLHHHENSWWAGTQGKNAFVNTTYELINIYFSLSVMLTQCVTVYYTRVCDTWTCWPVWFPDSGCVICLNVHIMCFSSRGILVKLVICVYSGHPKIKITNFMKYAIFNWFLPWHTILLVKNWFGNLIAHLTNIL